MITGQVKLLFLSESFTEKSMWKDHNQDEKSRRDHLIHLKRNACSRYNNGSYKLYDTTKNQNYQIKRSFACSLVEISDVLRKS